MLSQLQEITPEHMLGEWAAAEASGKPLEIGIAEVARKRSPMLEFFFKTKTKWLSGVTDSEELKSVCADIWWTQDAIQNGVEKHVLPYLSDIAPKPIPDFHPKKIAGKLIWVGPTESGPWYAIEGAHRSADILRLKEPVGDIGVVVGVCESIDFWSRWKVWNSFYDYIMTNDEFKQCTKRMLNQIWNTYINITYFRAFNEQFSPNDAVDILLTNHMWELWQETCQAFLTTAVFELTRIYDKTGHTLSIAKWINAGYYLNQAAIPRAEVDEDLKILTVSDPLVEKLIYRRNEGFFHIDLKQSKEGTDYGNIYPMSISECQELLDRALKFFNKYSQLFCSVPGCGNLGTCEPAVPAGDVATAFRWMKKEFDATKESRDAFEKKRVKPQTT